MPKSKPKAVRAWALVSPLGEILPGHCSSSRPFLLYHKTEWQTIVRVEIRPLPVKPRKAKRKA